MSLIEDALKTTRNYQRLLVTASSIILLFALALRASPDKVAYRNSVQRLLEFPFLEYENFAEERAEQAASEQLRPIAARVSATLDSAGKFNTDRLANAFLRPLHVGRILVGETIMSEPAGATLTQFDALAAALDTGRNVQVAVPRVKELLEEITEFLEEHTQAGLAIENIQVGLQDSDFVAQTFLPNSVALGSMYFELVSSVRLAGAPIFSANFRADVETIPGTSFEEWLFGQPGVDGLVARQDDKLVWLPDTREAPRAFREEKLGLLLARLTNEIDEGGPEKQKVSLLGASIPGWLLIFAAPFLLAVLAYYLRVHVRHLVQLDSPTGRALNEFAWMPLSLGDTHWRIELAMTIVVVPVASLIVLWAQLLRFGNVEVASTLGIVSGVGVIVFLATSVARDLAQVRSRRAASGNGGSAEKDDVKDEP